MKIDIISDIHLTCFEDQGANWIATWIPQGEVLILAGDVGEFHWWLNHLLHVRELCAKYQQVLFVAGNHEYYGATLNEGDARFREIAERIENFHFLERDVVEIGGKTFAGCTLWFPWNQDNPRYANLLSDFRLIRGFTPAVYDRNLDSQAFLKGLKEIDVVITHHLPSRHSIHETYAKDPTNRFFLCEVGPILQHLRPEVAIHGHTHVACDYQLGRTRVICNPMGYPRENDGPYVPVTIEL